ncbi:hypothetical protein BDW69DRAFT_115274 [Aspergillus filifer]
MSNVSITSDLEPYLNSLRLYLEKDGTPSSRTGTKSGGSQNPEKSKSSSNQTSSDNKSARDAASRQNGTHA